MSRSTDIKFFEMVGAISAVTIYMFAVNLISAIWVMLALGVAHHQWAVVPAFGYWATYVLINGLLVVTGALRYVQNQSAQKAREQ